MDVRLILDPPSAGSVNMSIDEALLESATRGETVLRFYAWRPATLSLGYFQAFEDRRLHVASSNLDVVRRSTGGGAIVHDQELTYSFVTPIAHRFSQHHQQLVEAFHETLCESLANWQIEANLHKFSGPLRTENRTSAKPSFLCFQRRSSDDVIVSGTKIAGSAQRRRRNAILQHGSVLLENSEFAPELSGIGQFARHPPNVDELTHLWATKIAARLTVQLVRGVITNEEHNSAEYHRKTRYEAADWQRRR